MGAGGCVEREKAKLFQYDLYNAVLSLTDDGAACVLYVLLVAIVKLYGMKDH